MKRRTSIAGALISGAMLVAGSAMAADMPAKAPLLKAPPMMPVYSWTGCYIGGGGGYGMWNQDNFLETDPGAVALTPTVTTGGRGWFGTGTFGCDYQVSSSFVIGVYGDYDFSDIKGQLAVGDPFQRLPGGFVGTESEKSAWAVGGRIGYLVSPTLLTYFSGGYTQARFDGVTFGSLTAPFGPAVFNLGSNTYNGWYLGSGFDYALSFLPSGFYLRSEYRYSTYNPADISLVFNTTGQTIGVAVDSKKYVQTVRSELIYRFNWH
jgi:outer membrane immunogenic protein